jgi:hypothetical protein
MSDWNPQREVEKRQHELATVDRQIAEDRAIRRTLETELTTLVGETQGRILTERERTQLRDLKLSIAQVDRGLLSVQQAMLGLGAIEGADARLAPLVGRPGLHALEKRRAKLVAEIAEWRAKVGIDPDEEVRCRLKAECAHMGPNGQWLKVGDEVLLTRRRLENLSDRFELVG